MKLITEVANRCSIKKVYLKRWFAEEISGNGIYDNKDLSYEKVKNFSKFTGKHLCQSFFFNKAAGSEEVLDVLCMLFYVLCLRGKSLLKKSYYITFTCS